MKEENYANILKEVERQLEEYIIDSEEKDKNVRPSDFYKNNAKLIYDDVCKLVDGNSNYDCIYVQKMNTERPNLSNFKNYLFIGFDIVDKTDDYYISFCHILTRPNESEVLRDAFCIFKGEEGLYHLDIGFLGDRIYINSVSFCSYEKIDEYSFREKVAQDKVIDLLLRGTYLPNLFIKQSPSNVLLKPNNVPCDKLSFSKENFVSQFKELVDAQILSTKNVDKSNDIASLR